MASKDKGEKLMDRKTQEIFFQNSADMDLLAETTNSLIKTIKEAGDPKKTKIEIRKADEFDSNLSPDEVIEQIDREITKTNDVFALDLLRVWKQDEYYVIVGVKL